MQKLLIAAAFSLAATPVLSADVFGVWKSKPNEEGAYIHVKIAPCGGGGGKVCGTIVEQVNSTSGNNIVGRSIIKDMEPDGASAWDGGTIWAPDDDKTYSSEMKLKGANTLEVSGCVLGGLICRGQDWTRVR